MDLVVDLFYRKGRAKEEVVRGEIRMMGLRYHYGYHYFPAMFIVFQPFRYIQDTFEMEAIFQFPKNLTTSLDGTGLLT